MPTPLFPSNSLISILSTHLWERRGSSACHVVFEKITHWEHWSYSFNVTSENGGIKKRMEGDRSMIRLKNWHKCIKGLANRLSWWRCACATCPSSSWPQQISNYAEYLQLEKLVLWIGCRAPHWGENMKWKPEEKGGKSSCTESLIKPVLLGLYSNDLFYCIFNVKDLLFCFLVLMLLGLFIFLKVLF